MTATCPFSPDRSRPLVDAEPPPVLPPALWLERAELWLSTTAIVASCLPSCTVATSAAAFDVPDDPELELDDIHRAIDALAVGPAATATMLPLPPPLPLELPPEKPSPISDSSLALAPAEPPCELALVQLTHALPVGSFTGEALDDPDAAPALLVEPPDAVLAECPAGRCTSTVTVGPLPALAPASTGGALGTEPACAV